MSDFFIRPIATGDLDSLMAAARLALPSDVITAELFARKVFLDLNYEKEGVLVAEAGGQAVGCIVSFMRRYRIEDMADDSSKAWVPLFFVHPSCQRKGVASALFDAVENRFRLEGKSPVLIGPYTPNWWFAGVDIAAYQPAIAFLESRGYDEIMRPLSMDNNLVHYCRPEWIQQKALQLESDGVTFAACTADDTADLFSFLKAEFPGDWQRHIRESLTRIFRGDGVDVRVEIAREKGNVIGFTHFDKERFGPFGTAAGVRGRGVGAVLLCRTMEAMRDLGYHNAYFLWTDDKAAKLYAEAGFRETRRFSLMKKDLI